MNKTVMNYAEVAKVAATLAAHCHKVTDTTCEYADGWDDERVAKEVDPRLTSRNVRSVREQIYGKLHRPITDEEIQRRLIHNFNLLVEELGRGELKV